MFFIKFFEQLHKFDTILILNQLDQNWQNSGVLSDNWEKLLFTIDQHSEVLFTMFRSQVIKELFLIDLFFCQWSMQKHFIQWFGL